MVFQLVKNQQHFMKTKKLVRFFDRFPQEKYAILILGKIDQTLAVSSLFRPLSHRTISPFIIGVAGGETFQQNVFCQASLRSGWRFLFQCYPENKWYTKI
jgi:hypothetical protein